MFKISKPKHWKFIKCWIELNFRYAFFFLLPIIVSYSSDPSSVVSYISNRPETFLFLNICSKLSKHDDFLFSFEIKCNWNIQKVQYFICRRKSYRYNDGFLYLPYIIVLKHLRIGWHTIQRNKIISIYDSLFKCNQSYQFFKKNDHWCRKMKCLQQCTTKTFIVIVTHFKIR